MEVLSLKTADEVVEEIMRLHKSLPTRPSIDEVEAAKALIRGVEKEDQAGLDAIARQTKGINVPKEWLTILLEMQKNSVFCFGDEQKREAMKLLDLENIYALFDEHIRRASECVSSGSNSYKASYSNGSSAGVVSTATKATSDATSVSQALEKPPTSSSSFYYSDNLPTTSGDLFTRADSYVKKVKSSFYADGIGSSPGSLLMPQIQDSTLKTGNAVGKFNIINSIDEENEHGHDKVVTQPRFGGIPLGFLKIWAIPGTLSVMFFVLVFYGSLASRIYVLNFTVPSFFSGMPGRSSGKPSVIRWPLNCTNDTVPQTCPTNYPARLENNLTSTESCPEYFCWIHEDLRLWKETGINREMLERPKAREFVHFRLVVLNGKPYLETFKKAYKMRDVFIVWEDFATLKASPTPEVLNVSDQDTDKTMTYSDQR